MFELKPLSILGPIAGTQINWWPIIIGIILLGVGVWVLFKRRK